MDIRKFEKVILYIILTIFGFIMLYPFIWMFLTSLKSSTEVLGNPLSLPQRMLFQNYVEAWKLAKYFGYYFFNSFFVAIVITILQLFICGMAAFAFARLEFPGRDALFMIFISTMMIPGQMLLIPNYWIIVKLGWYNTYFALIIPWIINVFNIFLLRQFFKSIPQDLIDAAIIDGANLWQVFWKIVVPLSKTIFATTGLFAFIFSWNSFIWPLIVTDDPKMQPLQVGLSAFSQAVGTDWNLLMAASMFVIMPLIILYFFTQKQLIESLSKSGLKG